MKVWKVFKHGSDVVTYVRVNDKDSRDTVHYAVHLARRQFGDDAINGVQLLAAGEIMQSGIPVLELYYPEHFVFDGVEYVLKSLCCSVWTNEAYGFCIRKDGTEGEYIVNFNNKEDLKPVSIELPMQ